MENQVALITGASSGIGKTIYLQLVDMGYKVYGTSRKIAKGEMLPVDGGTMVYLDVNDEQSTKETINVIYQKEGRLDALINNAGYGIAGSIEDTSHEEALAQFDTNFFGVMRTIRYATKYLVETKGIIINISSVAGLLSIPFQSMYTASKAALEALSETLKMELKQDGVRVCLVEPGDTKTSFTDNRIWAQNAKNSRYKERLIASIEKMEKDERNGAPPEKVAKTVCRMIKKKNPPIRRVVGFSYQFLVFLKRFMPDRLVIWALTKLYA
jgi:short-subunit dehydrogenase